ncbi:MAG: hypothetical protein ACK4NP_12240 [Parvularculaceae bacterium]
MPSFYERDATLPPLSSLLIAHGLILTLWFALFGIQPFLILGGWVGAHRAMGAAGLVLAVAVAASGLAAGADAMARGVGVAGRSPETFFYFSVADAILFASLVAAALRARRIPDAHKRFMTVASVSILFPALGRLMTHSGFDGVFAVIPYAALLAAIAGFDLVVLRRLHPATLIGAGAALAKVASYLPFGASAPWHAAVRALGLAVGA